jgi:hypothetical protein
MSWQSREETESANPWRDDFQVARYPGGIGYLLSG